MMIFILTPNPVDSRTSSSLIYVGLGGQKEGCHFSDSDFGYSLIFKRMGEWSGLITIADYLGQLPAEKRPNEVFCKIISSHAIKNYSNTKLLIDDSFIQLISSEIANCQKNIVKTCECSPSAETLTASDIDFLDKINPEASYGNISINTKLSYPSIIRMETSHFFKLVFVIKNTIGHFLNYEKRILLNSGSSNFSPPDLNRVANLTMMFICKANMIILEHKT